MKSNFEKSLEYVLQHEGGWAHHKLDPGGETNKGITRSVYDSYRKMRGRPSQSVKFISEEEVRAIYKFQYWDRVQGDLLPTGVDYAVFDFAVNSGVGRASKYLQAVVGVAQDGIIGARTVAAVTNPIATINALCDRRMGFLRNLRTFLTFGRGWARRVQGVRAHALEMAT